MIVSARFSFLLHQNICGKTFGKQSPKPEQRERREVGEGKEERERKTGERERRERWRAVQQQLAAVMTVVASIACLSVKTNLRRQPPGGPAALFVIETLYANIVCTNRIQ